MIERSPGDLQSWGTPWRRAARNGAVRWGAHAFAKMVELKPGLVSYNRMGFYRFVQGDAEGGIALMKEAVKAGAKYPENKAWCLVELGSMYFKTGRWTDAEGAYSEAIQTFPTSHAAHAGLGAVRAAQGKLPEAIESYRRAQSITPMVQYAGVLHDLYLAAGKKAEAQTQADMIDLSAKLEEAANQKANRTLALIYANQDRNLTKSLELAQADFEIRQDIYTHDALAWSLYKNKRYEEASRASQAALKTGAPEALLFYHAGMIAQASGDPEKAKKQLERAHELNAGFDIRQAAIARQALRQISEVK